MEFLSLHAQATLLRCAPRDRPGGHAEDEVVSTGPLILIACGVAAMPPEQQKGLWVRTAHGRLDLAEIKALVRDWREPQRR